MALNLNTIRDPGQEDSMRDTAPKCTCGEDHLQHEHDIMAKETIMQQSSNIQMNIEIPADQPKHVRVLLVQSPSNEGL